MSMVDELLAGLRAIVSRCDETRTAKVRDVRRIAAEQLAKFEPVPAKEAKP